MYSYVSNDYYWSISTTSDGKQALLLSDYNGDALESGTSVIIEYDIIPQVDVSKNVDMKSISIDDEMIVDALIHGIMVNIGKKFIKDKQSVEIVAIHEQFYKEALIELKRKYRGIKR